MSYQNTGKNRQHSSVIRELQCSPLTSTRIPTKTKPNDVIEGTPLTQFRRMLTSAGKSSSNNFTVEVDEKFKHVENMIILQAIVAYDYDTVLPDILYIFFKNFPVASAKTGSGYDYHAAIPTIEATQVGDDMKLAHTFPDHYRLYIGTKITLKKFRLQVFYEDKTTGEFVLYTGLQNISIEVLFK